MGKVYRHLYPQVYYRFTAILLIVTMPLILSAIPWPGLDYGRPWVRG